MRKLAIIAMIALSPTNAFADAKELSACFQKDGDAKSLVDAGGWGYCMGVVSAIGYFRDELGLCIPKGVKVGQIVAVLEKYVDNSPELWHLKLQDLILRATKSAWPCKP